MRSWMRSPERWPGATGAFSIKRREARLGRNPRTGEHVDVDQKAVPFFKTGKEMRERLNASP